MSSRRNVIPFPGVERELVLELATALARYGAGAQVLERLRRARRPDPALKTLRVLKEMNADTFEFEALDSVRFK